MNNLNKNRIAVAVAAAGLTIMPFLSGVAEAKGKKSHDDNGKHLGWDKGKGNKHDERREWKPVTSKKSTVRSQWTKPRSTTKSPSRSNYRPVSGSNSSGKLLSTRSFSTRASANRAAALRRQLGYNTTLSYDAKRRVYVLREYEKASTTRRTVPVSTSRLIGTHYYATQQSAAAGMRFAQSKGYRATSVYDRANNRWIVRTYTR